MKSPTPILFVIDELIEGGGPRVCFNLIERLDRREFSPCVVTLFRCGRLGQALEKMEIPLLNLNVQAPFSLTSARRYLPVISRFAVDNQVALIHAHLTAAGLYASAIAFKLGVPSIFTAHGQLVKRLPFRWAEVLVRNLHSNVIGVSRGVEEEARRCIIWPGRRLQHIYNGVDTDYWKSDDRRDLPFPCTGEGITITMVANFFKEKDHRSAIDAFAGFRDRFPHSRLLLVGEGELRQEVEHWVRDKAIDRVYFTGSSSDIFKLLEETDIFLLSTFTEGISIAVLEAMSMGLPVVASHVGSMAEIITHGENGLLVEEGKPEQMEDALVRLCSDGALRRRLRQNARERVEAAFSLQAMNDAYSRIYRELIER